MLSSRPGAIYQQDNARPHLRDSPNNVFKDMTSYHGLPDHQIFRQYGKQLQPSRYRRINCADAKTMAGSSTGGHK
ncbi:hypothetical protein TNCV_1180101 [Trichonephila clavipes]|nr:hypothetical protein TNCV_1180101 [Trichonephila clavipes]